MAYEEIDDEEEELEPPPPPPERRYAPETVGMPAELASIAARNLAKEDAGISSVNAVARMRSVLPGVGAYGSTPETDATNLATAAAMDRADIGSRFGFGSPQYQSASNNAPVPSLTSALMDDIGARRQEVDAQKRQVMVRLGMIPPSAVGLSAAVLAKPSDRKYLLNNLKILDNQSKALRQEHRNAATANAKEIDEENKHELDIIASSDFADYARGLSAIEKNPDTQSGTPGYFQSLVDLSGTHFAGANTKAGLRLTAGAMQRHKEAEAFKRSHTETKLQKAVEDDLVKEGLTPEEFQQHTNPRATTSGEVGDIADIEKNRADKGQNVAFDVGGRTILVGRQVYERWSKVLPKAAAAPTQAQPSIPTAQPVAPPEMRHIDENGADLGPTRDAKGDLLPLPKGSVGVGGFPRQAESPAAPVAKPLPAGTQRTINGVQAEWDGKGWKRTK